MFSWIKSCLLVLRGKLQTNRWIANVPFSPNLAQIARAYQRMETALAGNRRLQAVSEESKATRITTLLIQVNLAAEITLQVRP